MKNLQRETVISPGSDDFSGKFHQKNDRSNNTHLTQIFQVAKRKILFLTHFMKLVLPLYQNQTKIFKKRKITSFANGGNSKWYCHFGKHLADLIKYKHRLP